MGLSHRFFCLEEGEGADIQYWNYLEIRANVAIHDDLMRYVNDTLNWVPCLHFSGSKFRRTHGLFLYGTTIINQEGAITLYPIVESWKNLFLQAPDEFELTGPVLLDSDRKSTGEFYKIKVDRDLLISNLSILSTYASRVMDGKHYILHLGI